MFLPESRGVLTHTRQPPDSHSDTFNTTVLNVSTQRRPVRQRPPNGSDAEHEAPTRARILRVAERLFAERGVDSVSLVEIGAAAGQKNRSAVQYHFGDKAGLVAAIREAHQPAIEKVRAERLDALEADPRASLRDFVEVLVRPLADHVRRAEGGVAYVRISASLLGHPEFSPMSRRKTAEPTSARLLSHFVRRTTTLPPEQVGPRMLLVTGMLFHGLADHLRDGGGRTRLDEETWTGIVDNLVACIVAVLEATAPEVTAPGARPRRGGAGRGA
jgi:AcrR family transcriptional regulator